MTAELMRTKEYFLKTVSSVLNGEAVQAVPEDLNFAKLCLLGERNCVQGILYKAFLPMKDRLPEAEFAKLENEYRLCAVRQITQDEEVKFLREAFEKKGVGYMFLKGSHLKKLYPSPELRFMVDMDILLFEDGIEAGREILLSRGFNLKLNNGKDIIFIKKPFLTVELHRSLFQKDYYMYGYFSDCLNRAVPESGGEYKMTDEDMYVYTMAHLAEHYTTAGSCFRPVMDLYLMEKKINSLDFSYIEKQFEIIGISNFSKNIRRLAKAMFESGERDETLDIMENYIVLGPPVKNADAASQMAVKGNSRLKSFFGVIFPSFGHMKLKYPVLEKLPILLPVLWAVRLFSLAFSKNKAVVRKKEQFKHADRKSAETLEKIFRISGL